MNTRPGFEDYVNEKCKENYIEECVYGDKSNNEFFEDCDLNLDENVYEELMNGFENEINNIDNKIQKHEQEIDDISKSELVDLGDFGIIATSAAILYHTGASAINGASAASIPTHMGLVAAPLAITAGHEVYNEVSDGLKLKKHKNKKERLEKEKERLEKQKNKLTFDWTQIEEKEPEFYDPRQESYQDNELGF